MGFIFLRVLFIFVMGTVGYFLPPLSLENLYGAIIGVLIGIIVVYLEHLVKRAQFKVIWGATMGVWGGIIFGWILSSIYKILSPDKVTSQFISFVSLIVLPYMGFIIGLKKSEWFNPVTLFTFLRERSAGRSYKILDTSVIIDGRIMDICDTGFVEGTLVVPQFVLRELQQVADSPDPLKRQRGRRGLDILQKLQKSSTVSVMVSELDFPEIKDVDSKLIELAKQLDAKIITNDFNLNKVAQLHRISVLNINELSNALKPVVLPGETMKVFILKEGKEKDQGVAYLDDGTMVVVDNARKMIGKNIDITVTSVLQTTAGKMIFGRFNEE
jgi:uncharacterized protein YacL